MTYRVISTWTTFANPTPPESWTAFYAPGAWDVAGTTGPYVTPQIGGVAISVYAPNARPASPAVGYTCIDSLANAFITWDGQAWRNTLTGASA